MSHNLTSAVTVQVAPIIDHDVAAAHRKQASATVARADVDNLRDDPEAKAAFLSTFTAAEEKKIMRKVDRCFILLTGIMYLIKQIDVNNAANIKVLHVGQPSNILQELKMSSNDYNWVASIYGVSGGFSVMWTSC
ncbi:hypothetical protein DPSP01_000857 [Paraphaeosphaeria sporulosa]